MQIITTVSSQERQFRLRDSFLEPYYNQGDPFTTLLARSTYLTKYSRGAEVWTDTVRRVVEGNIALSSTASEREAEMLFQLFWTGQALPPGRGLWVGGIPGIPADARYNCWSTSLYSIDDWCWIANQLMLGGGVGVGLHFIDRLAPVAAKPCKLAVWCRSDHPNIEEVSPNPKEFLNGNTPVHLVPDSREGWVDALRQVLTAAWEGRDLIVDVSPVRERGLPIRTFGGIACGPGPLTNLLRSVWEIVRGAAGRRMNSVECLDVTNLIGFCVKSGNVRRSALIVLGDAEDQAFRDAKKDFNAIKSHRHTSNNSLAFRSWAQIQNFDWRALVEDNATFGEPGLLNLPLIWKTDPGVTGINPCFSGDTLVAVADGRNAVPIRQLAEEGRDVPVYSMDRKTGKVEIKMGRHPRATGFHKKLVRVWLDDGSYLDTTPDHKFILLDGSIIEARNLQAGSSLPRFAKLLEKVKAGGKPYYRVYCDTKNPSQGKVFEHRLIAKFHFPEQWAAVYADTRRNGFTNTGGLVVHHEDYDQLNNAPCNLKVMTFKDHCKLHGSKDNSGVKNGNSTGISSSEIREQALSLTLKLGRRFSKKEWSAFALERNLPTQFSSFRVGELGSILQLAQWCAAELGFEHGGVDPRVVRTYQAMLSQGYDACICGGKVIVAKACELCGDPFAVEHSYRERAFCSEKCGNAYINSDPSVKQTRIAKSHALYNDRMKFVKTEQARVASSIRFMLGRNPNRKEWSLACKKEGVPSRIGPTLRFGYQNFNQVLEAASNYNHKVVRVEDLPELHTVYNITVDEHHTVGLVTNVKNIGGRNEYRGVFTPQCGEVPLHDREACNLAEAFPAMFEGQTEASSVFRLLTRYCLRQRLTPLLDAQADAVRTKNMRLGVGLGGICDFEWTTYQLADWFLTCRKEASAYADELGVARPNAVTTTKPSGTISLLNGSSPGIHAPYAEHYIRRARIAKNDPMAPALIEAGVPHEEDIYDHTGHTWVFAFPSKARHTNVTVQTETIRDQFRRQADVQEWWADNAVSATLSFEEHEKEELVKCFAEYVPRLKSTSCLPKAHGYEQAPYEAISEEKFREMSVGIRNDHKLVKGGEFEIDECATGVCPIK